MLFSRVILGASLSLLLAGCNAANVQPQSDLQTGQAAAATESDQGSPAVDAGVENAPSRPVNTAQISNQLDQLSGRLVLMQEQLIQLNSASKQQAEMNQILLTRLQHLSASSVRTAAEDQASSDREADATGSGALIDDAIDQLMQTVNQLGLADAGDLFAVASAYTAKGSWVLIRYRVDSGETWLADQGSWVRLEEEAGSLPASRYAVQLQRADQDLKGFVAVRIDRQSGESWWLNDRRWQVYQ
ncbi:hypothetical protein GCM10011352_22220 [Marinobacterium zhoushanense]|uniref:Uncharacterized protein n=1 Tax=Marinobacterium zhoushanense TaxID=1679163 RepID=A0ABQ1KFV8_9GAMM|nr:hypothetical protein [Marinobacterium zhoushanense]GGB95677.1 hypothetical protein GCM10011352_22220 [Marinobacterium zhoushanense]